MKVANAAAMTLVANHGKTTLIVTETVIETRPDALLLAKNIKAFARSLPDKAPRGKKTRKARTSSPVKSVSDPSPFKSSRRRKAGADAETTSASDD